jgi:hypothetical protein
MILSGLTKQKITMIISVIFIFVISSSLFNVAIDKAGWFKYKQADAGTIPSIYYLMVGMNDERFGAWNQNDYNIIFDECTTKQERTERSIKEIKQRLNDYKVDGYIKFLTKKSTWEWGDGTYFAPVKLAFPHLKDSVLHEWFLYEGKHYNTFAYYSQTFQVVMIFLILASIYIRLKLGKIDSMLLVNLSIFGIYVFLLLWEARSRYILNFTPLLLISAIDGFCFISSSISIRFSQRKENITN